MKLKKREHTSRPSTAAQSFNQGSPRAFYQPVLKIRRAHSRQLQPVPKRRRLHRVRGRRREASLRWSSRRPRAEHAFLLPPKQKRRLLHFFAALPGPDRSGGRCRAGEGACPKRTEGRFDCKENGREDRFENSRVLGSALNEGAAPRCRNLAGSHSALP